MNLTEVGRALKQLGIDHIAAYSPEARGRSERAFQTHQGRLPQELARAGITEMQCADQYLEQVYRIEHNREFAVASALQGTAQGAVDQTLAEIKHGPDCRLCLLRQNLRF